MREQRFSFQQRATACVELLFASSFRMPRLRYPSAISRKLTRRSAALEGVPRHSGYPVEDAVAYPEPEEVTETQGRFSKPTPFSPERIVAQEHQDIVTSG